MIWFTNIYNVWICFFGSWFRLWYVCDGVVFWVVVDIKRYKNHVIKWRERFLLLNRGWLNLTLERNSFSVCVSVQGIYKVGDGISVHKKYKKISIGFVRWHVRDRYRPHNKRLTYSGHNHLLFLSSGVWRTRPDKYRHPWSTGNLFRCWLDSTRKFVCFNVFCFKV